MEEGRERKNKGGVCEVGEGKSGVEGVRRTRGRG